MKYTGIHAPAVTPFNDDYSIDVDGFKEVLQKLLKAGVDGIVIGGTTGEYYALSKEERILTWKIAKEVVGKKAFLTLGIGALRTEDAISLGLEAKKIGADAVLLGSPYYAMPDEDELIYHLTTIDANIDMPIVLYNFPDRVGVNMTKTVLDAVCRSGNVIAIKESSGDINRLHMVARDYPHIQLCCGMDDQALEFFAWGATSWICAASNFLPKEHIALYKACVEEKNFDKGREIMSAMMPLMQILEQGGKFVQCIKYGNKLKGIPAGEVRKPLRKLRKEKDLIRTLTEVIGRVEENVAIAIEKYKK
ncbi:MAG: dihydrodipicolinate synthase family protein [Alphaproteobacteria bacterium]